MSATASEGPIQAENITTTTVTPSSHDDTALANMEIDANISQASSLSPAPADPLLVAARTFPGHVSRPAETLIGLTVQRQVELRSGISQPNLSRIANREAILAQAVGDEEGTPCIHCGKGEGVFTSCVRVCIEDDLHLLKGSCASCHANSLGSRCSLRRK